MRGTQPVKPNAAQSRQLGRYARGRRVAVRLTPRARIVLLAALHKVQPAGRTTLVGLPETGSAGFDEPKSEPVAQHARGLDGCFHLIRTFQHSDDSGNGTAHGSRQGSSP